MSTLLSWAAFGAAVRWWQLGIQMRPFFSRETALGYPLYIGAFGAFGYWLQGVEMNQTKILEERKLTLLEKRRKAGLGELKGNWGPTYPVEGVKGVGGSEVVVV
ncbi:hypothetical protein BDZ91DRAFT_849371 [Kalaharituber pfeilii]|nr:hypothetical protein BDZ91DRAFT_849371 [Kalaharituber pfeilii]